MNARVQTSVLAALALAAGLATVPCQAEENAGQKPAPAAKPAPEVVYGSQLMTAQERRALHQKIRAAKTDEERQQIRAEHHAAMQARAKERGVTLPDTPPAIGGGMGPGKGMGGGMGTGMGGGMGPRGGQPAR